MPNDVLFLYKNKDWDLLFSLHLLWEFKTISISQTLNISENISKEWNINIKFSLLRKKKKKLQVDNWWENRSWFGLACCSHVLKCYSELLLLDEVYVGSASHQHFFFFSEEWVSGWTRKFSYEKHIFGDWTSPSIACVTSQVQRDGVNSWWNACTCIKSSFSEREVKELRISEYVWIVLLSLKKE